MIGKKQYNYLGPADLFRGLIGSTLPLFGKHIVLNPDGSCDVFVCVRSY